MIQDQIDSNLSSPETSGPSLTDDQNERSSSDDFEDLFGRKSKEKGPDSMQQLQNFLSFQFLSLQMKFYSGPS